MRFERQTMCADVRNRGFQRAAGRSIAAPMWTSDWVRGLASILLAFEPRGWDVETEENKAALRALRDMGINVCAYHLPVPIPHAVAATAPGSRPDRIADAHKWVANLGVELVAEPERRGGHSWSFAWVAWVLTHQEPWTFNVGPHRIDAEQDGLRRALESATRLGGPDAAHALLLDEGDCNCNYLVRKAG